MQKQVTMTVDGDFSAEEIERGLTEMLSDNPALFFEHRVPVFRDIKVVELVNTTAQVGGHFV